MRNNRYYKNISESNHYDFDKLVALIDELANLPGNYEDNFGKRVRAKFYLGNILENVVPKEKTEFLED